MSNEWDEYAKDWDGNLDVEKYASNTFAELVNIVNIDGLSILDFGCGIGTLTKLLSPQA